MTPAWDDLNARARGLGTHLLEPAQMAALSREPDAPSLAAALRREGVLTTAMTEAPSPQDLELAIRRWAAALLRILARWAGSRAAVLPLVFDEEDRRSLRSVLRGSVQHVPAEQRLAGLIPTPALPERALEELARTATPADAAALLAVWHHPFATTVLPAAAAAQPDLFALDLALSRAVAVRATDAARQSRSGTLRSWVRDTIDLENARSAILLSTAGDDVVPADVFLPGGQHLTFPAFERAVMAREPGAVAMQLATAFAGTPYGATFMHAGRDVAALEHELVQQRMDELARERRRAPLGPLPVLWFALQLRTQVVDLQRIVWTVALNAPRGSLDIPFAATA